MNKTGQEVAGLGISLAVCFGAAILGSLLTTPHLADWYATLNKPSWNPPSWIFGPVWTTLFAMMALAAWLVWRARPWPASAPPLGLFALQLILNVCWSGLFFALHRPDLALVDIGLLWLAILLTLIAFWRVQTLAGLLMLPYLLWVSFAAALNFQLWRLNG